MCSGNEVITSVFSYRNNFKSGQVLKKRFALDLSMQEWAAWCAERSFAGYVAKQIFEWVYGKGNLSPQTFSSLPKKCRECLQEEFSWSSLKVDSPMCSRDGSIKSLLRTEEGALIEMVLMPYAQRTTLCLSSQVGCRMGCTFCQTAKLGFKRNLSSGEMLEQIFLAKSQLEEGRRVSNVVFMGMGEPLDNFDEVVKACAIMVDPKGLGMSRSRVTISTSGLVPEIRRLGQVLPLRLAISLHTAEDAKRSALMPVNRRYPLAALKEALLEYPAKGREGITFEYVMIDGQNDSLEDAKKLVSFVHGLKAKVNLIPFNHFPNSPLAASRKERIEAFAAYLSKRSIPSPVRYSRGQDVSGGCGQLAAKREGELDLDPRHLRKKEGSLPSKEILQGS